MRGCDFARRIALGLGLSLIILGGCGTAPGQLASSDGTPPSTSDGDSNPRGGNAPVLPAEVETPPTLSFSAEPVFCCDPRGMTFTASIAAEGPVGSVLYRWDFGDGRSARGPQATHTFGWPGEYRVRLTATLEDGTLLGAEQAFSFAADQVPDGTDPPDPPTDPIDETPDEAPVLVIADAGADREAIAGEKVTLDGSGSTGSGQDPLGYEWRQHTGPTVVLTNPYSPIATFTAPSNLRRTETFVFALIVRQGAVMDAETVQVSVLPPPPPDPPLPTVQLAVTLADGVFIPILTPDEGASTPDRQSYSGDWGEALVQKLDATRYELTLRAKVNLARVWFPYFANEYACERILYPHLLGLEVDNSRLNRAWSYEEIAVYPGQTVFPGAVMESPDEGRGVFAANWPPLEVKVLYSRGKVALRYDQTLAAGGMRKYRCMIADTVAQPGVEPWHLAVDAYRDWLLPNMQQAGLWPVVYPEWLRTAHGWSNVQLQDYDDPVGETRYRWEQWGHMFPVIQTWGSMSDRHHPPDLSTGCCLIDTSLHPRNAELPQVAQMVVEGGGYFGYYARPRNTGPVAGTHPDATANREWLLEWLNINRTQLGGNIDYLDWFIARPLGPVLDVAFQFRDGLWSHDTVCERAVDVYPTAFLMSGALWGGARYFTKPEQTIADAPLGQTGIVFPRLVRYLLDDRIVLLGESNGDNVMWGSGRGAYHFGERQAFLLGCKLDWMQRPDGGGPNDPAVPVIVNAWESVNFWHRDPVYMDTVGLTQVPPSVDVRRFRGRDGETILAVDHRNAESVHPAAVLVDGRSVSIPGSAWLELVVVAP